jgi:hypothetical protein
MTAISASVTAGSKCVPAQRRAQRAAQRGGGERGVRHE